jgi:hypothetical protein
MPTVDGLPTARKLTETFPDVVFRSLCQKEGLAFVGIDNEVMISKAHQEVFK